MIDSTSITSTKGVVLMVPRNSSPPPEGPMEMAMDQKLLATATGRAGAAVMEGDGAGRFSICR